MNDRILIDPDIQGGKPVIRGTRMPIGRVLGSLAGGMTEEEVMREYDLTREDLQAAYAYAAGVIDSERVYPLPQTA